MEPEEKLAEFIRWAARNMMTIGTFVLAFAAGLTAMADALPAEQAAWFASAIMVATALGRAAVVVAENLRDAKRAPAPVFVQLDNAARGEVVTGDGSGERLPDMPEGDGATPDPLGEDGADDGQ